MERYEYYTMTYETKGFWGGKVEVNEFQNELNRLGDAGWELVSSVATTQGQGTTKYVVCIFKRKKL
ncbi:MAG: DUF4177 domain-containing protein [Cellulosilyticum sp.]|nr:DUF4177 domain-containing protein [Cellulosilyticum sp.]